VEGANLLIGFLAGDLHQGSMQDERRAANYAAPLPAVVIKIPNIVLGKLPLNAMVTTYLGPIDFLKEEGLSVEIMPSQAGPAINQAICRYWQADAYTRRSTFSGSAARWQ
jgi:hypothetical protein